MKVCSKCGIDIVVEFSGNIDFGNKSEDLSFEGELCDICLKKFVNDIRELITRYNLSTTVHISRKFQISSQDFFDIFSGKK